VDVVVVVVAVVVVLFSLIVTSTLVWEGSYWIGGGGDGVMGRWR